MPQRSLLLVHGAWHGGWCWREGFAQRLEKAGYAVHTPDLPAHGERLDPVALRSLRGPRLRDYVDDLIGVIEDLPAGPPPVVVGHSMGGGVVQHLIAREDRPDIAGAVLLASMPPAGVWRVSLDTARRRPGRFLSANLRRDLGLLLDDDEHVRSMLFTATTGELMVTATRERLHNESYRAFLDMLLTDRPRPRPGRVPVRVLGAGADTIFSVGDARRTAAAWGTEARIVPGLGHDVMLDDGWPIVADQVATWAGEMTGQERRATGG